MVHSIKPVLIGSVGTSASVIAPDLIANVGTNEPNIVNVITQLVILVSTLITLFKRKKNNN